MELQKGLVLISNFVYGLYYYFKQNTAAHFIHVHRGHQIKKQKWNETTGYLVWSWKIQNYDEKTNPEELVSRAFFLTYLIRGSKFLNSFELETVYSPSIFGIPREKIPDGIISAYMDSIYIIVVEVRYRTTYPEAKCHKERKCFSITFIMFIEFQK